MKKTNETRRRENMYSEYGQNQIRFLLAMALSNDELFHGGISPMDAELQKMGFTEKQCGAIEVGLHRIIRKIAAKMPTEQENIDAQLAAADERRRQVPVWSHKHPAVLESDYPGKAEKAAKAAADYAAAVLVRDREIVVIEGRKYMAKYTGPHYSDPVKFVPVVER